MRIVSGVLFVWAGLLFGISFVATPAKFLAPSLSMAQALDVGRWTFHVLTWVECGVAAVTFALLTMAWRNGAAGLCLMIGLVVTAIAIIAAQSLGLRPVLDERVRHVIAGETCRRAACMPSIFFLRPSASS